MEQGLARGDLVNDEVVFINHRPKQSCVLELLSPRRLFRLQEVLKHRLSLFVFCLASLNYGDDARVLLGDLHTLWLSFFDDQFEHEVLNVFNFFGAVTELFFV